MRPLRGGKPGWPPFGRRSRGGGGGCEVEKRNEGGDYGKSLAVGMPSSAWSAFSTRHGRTRGAFRRESSGGRASYAALVIALDSDQKETLNRGVQYILASLLLHILYSSLAYFCPQGCVRKLPLAAPTLDTGSYVSPTRSCRRHAMHASGLLRYWCADLRRQTNVKLIQGMRTYSIRRPRRDEVRGAPGEGGRAVDARRNGSDWALGSGA